MSEAPDLPATPDDPWTAKFLAHLATARDASPYTVRNYRQALRAMAAFARQRRGAPLDWAGLEREDFRDFLRFLGRSKLSRAAIQLRFSALRSFYKFLIQNGVASISPIKKLSLPKPPQRLPVLSS